MAIKFSQFTVRTNSSDLSHIVGYNGVDNIQITPTNFLNSALTGTAGQVLYYDTTGVAGENAFFWDNTNKRLGIGTNTPNYRVHIKDNSVTTGSKTLLQLQSDPINNGGSLNLDFRVSSANTDDRYVARISGMREGNGALSQLQFWTDSSGLYQRMTITSAGNVGIGTSSPSEKLEVVGNIKVGDSQSFSAGASDDLQIFHNGTDNFYNGTTGDMYFVNKANDKDIVFQSDNGSGGYETYFFLDGSSSKTVFPDNKQLQIGSGGGDGYIYSDGTNMWIQGNNPSADIKLYQGGSDGSIRFYSDNGSGGVAEYFAVDGGEEQVRFFKETEHADNVKAKFGDAGDLEIYHDGSNSFIRNTNTNLIIKNEYDDGDIIFESDDGSGNIAEYFRVDGSSEKIIYSKNQWLYDNIRAVFGSSDDLQIYHNGTNSLIENSAGDLYISNKQDDGDIIFFCDDGSGGTAEYFRVDGSNTNMNASKTIVFNDNVKASFGDSEDLKILHNGTDSVIINERGNLEIQQRKDDGDIIFTCDDGGGGLITYFLLDGSLAAGSVPVTRFPDNSKLGFGDSTDLQIYHNASDSVIENNVGDLYITNKQDDGDIIFRTDNGSGAFTEYFKLDGGSTLNIFYKPVFLGDGVKSLYGNSSDLQIYHDGSNSFIDDTGTGILYIRAAANMYFQTYGSGKRWASFFENQGIELFYNDVKKLETRSTGIKISGVSEYADNTAAIAGGLTTGDVYRTGDLLKIVH